VQLALHICALIQQTHHPLNWQSFKNIPAFASSGSATVTRSGSETECIIDAPADDPDGVSA
jgi:hypothetical protein